MTSFSEIMNVDGPKRSAETPCRELASHASTAARPEKTWPWKSTAAESLKWRPTARVSSAMYAALMAARAARNGATSFVVSVVYCGGAIAGAARMARTSEARTNVIRRFQTLVNMHALRGTDARVPVVATAMDRFPPPRYDPAPTSARSYHVR